MAAKKPDIVFENLEALMLVPSKEGTPGLIEDATDYELIAGYYRKYHGANGKTFAAIIEIIMSKDAPSFDMIKKTIVKVRTKHKTPKK